MQFHYIPYIWPLAVSAAVSLSLGLYALLVRRNVKGTVSFMLSMFVVTIWSSANALEMAGADFYTKLFWANMQYFAYCYSPVALLALCMQFTGYDRWVKNKKILWVAIIPTIILVLVWTNSVHSLIRYDIHLDYSGTFPVISKKYGPAFYIHMLYSHSVNIAALVLTILAMLSKNKVYRKQAAALFAGIILIVLPNLLYISGLSPVKKFDLTPVFFGPAGLVIAWGIYRYRLFDIVPLARASLIESMDTGVMVMDLHDRVLDINPSFRMISGLNNSNKSVITVNDVFSNIPELLKACKDYSSDHCEFIRVAGGTTKIYEALFSSLADSNGQVIARLVVAHEVTAKKQAQQEFLKQQRELAAAEEREQLARDMHDNLGQVLGYANAQLQGIRQELLNAGVESATDRLDRLISVIQEAHTEIREYIKSVRNSLYVEKGFLSELAKEISSFEKQTGVEVKLDIPDCFNGAEVTHDGLRNILNIIREALSNIRKHAAADSVRVSLFLFQEQLQVAVEDNGKGFDINEYGNKTENKYGLAIMRERAEEIGAQLDIESALGKGSRIVLNVPVKGG